MFLTQSFVSISCIKLGWGSWEKDVSCSERIYISYRKRGWEKVQWGYSMMGTQSSQNSCASKKWKLLGFDGAYLGNIHLKAHVIIPTYTKKCEQSFALQLLTDQSYFVLPFQPPACCNLEHPQNFLVTIYLKIPSDFTSQGLCPTRLSSTSEIKIRLFPALLTIWL